ncbi:hypothetical protein HPB47_026171 [Ixodes persulcatus]|uniref:Uncharacterized protein n=1 Tax=Ixodes persulcatus TaxID=34615 RepID=A0AC60Q0P8_IXOPE|nr:hypothetical protein HPB47_026171 [Ixodes persulcatus]
MRKFPADEKLHAVWTRLARPSCPTWVPAPDDRLCSDHFRDDDYKRSPRALKSFGLPTKSIRLKPGVVPSIFSKKRKANPLSEPLEKPRKVVWNKHQLGLFTAAAGKKLTIAGDGRADSPGHSAKYGTYTMFHVDSNKVLQVETAQSNETDGSYHMELEGLKRSLNIFEAHRLVVGILVTYRHPQLHAWQALEHPDIRHLINCWHVAKGKISNGPLQARSQDFVSGGGGGGRP